jgi:transcription initiation factor TFIIE subunit alpha
MSVAVKMSKSKSINSKKANKAVKKAKITSKKAAPAVARSSAKSLKNAKLTQRKPLLKKPEEPVPDKPTAQNHEFMRKVGKILGDSNVRQDLIEIGGENALAIVRNFYGNHSDEELAKRLKIKISDVRATLNKLHNEGLVNYIREKDSETGWYSYSWSLNQVRMEKWANIHTVRTGAISNESGGDYYFCPSCGAASITNFESAAGIDFRCERCNKLLEFIDEKKMAELFEKNQKH